MTTDSQSRPTTYDPSAQFRNERKVAGSESVFSF